MKYEALQLSLLFFGSLANAAKFPMTRRSSTPYSSLHSRSGQGSVYTPNVLAASAANGIDVNSIHDLIYLANITVGGTDYVVQIDTGSSDLWIKGPSSPLPGTNPTANSYNLTYGIGWANGTISFASVELAGVTVQQQVFVDASSAQNPALSYGGDGIAGLGFTSLSALDEYYNRTNSASGRSFLYNAFAVNTSEPNFISFALPRSSNTDVTGMFTIGEVDPVYSAVLNSSPVSTFPPNSPQRWNVLLDAVLQVGGQTIPVSSTVAGAPTNKAVVLLDSGTSYIYAPPDVCTAIYGSISGAEYSSTVQQWTIPCDAEVDVAFQIGGAVYPLHPLDVTVISDTDPNTCYGAFVPQPVAVGANQFDWLIGDAFLRSVYTLYDFGDFDSSGNMGNPYVKLLSIIDPDKASAEFHQARGGTANSGISYNAANVSSSDSSTNVQVSTELANTLNKIGTYVPVMLAIMGLNALVIILLLVAAGIYLCRRRSNRHRRKTVGRMSPRPFAHRTTAFDMPGIQGSHTYEPVSMALTDDTFVPPTPAFSKPGFDDSGSMKSPLSALEPLSARPASVA